MDFITQGLFGAAAGEAVCGHKLGRRATLWGAFGGLLPDLDVLASSLMGPTAHMTFHRGPPHALWVGPVGGSLLGYRLYFSGLLHDLYRVIALLCYLFFFSGLLHDLYRVIAFLGHLLFFSGLLHDRFLVLALPAGVCVY